MATASPRYPTAYELLARYRAALTAAASYHVGRDGYVYDTTLAHLLKPGGAPAATVVAAVDAFAAHAGLVADPSQGILRGRLTWLAANREVH